MHPTDIPDVIDGIILVDRDYDSLTIQLMPGYLGGDDVMYYVEYRSSSDISFKPISSNGKGTSNTTVNIPQLQPSSIYELRAKAENSIGMGPFSDNVIFSTIGMFENLITLCLHKNISRDQ